MLRISLLLLLLIPVAASSGPWFQGEPTYNDDMSRKLALEMLDAHGGMEAMAAASSIQFNFFTKMLGNPTPFYSYEALDLTTGDAYVHWPFWDSTISWNQNSVWTQNWPMPLPAGFFVRLTSSFLTLPWQIQTGNADISIFGPEKLPGDNTVYDVLHVTYDERHPGIPGTFYDLFIHPETKLMAGIRFNINHPGMVANPKQPLGPNYHVFGDYRTFDGLVIPTFYESYGQGSTEGGRSNAYHFVWNMDLDQPFDSNHMVKPADAVVDEVSTSWWRSGSNPISVGDE